MPRFAMKLNENLTRMIEEMTGAEVPQLITDNPYVIIQPISQTEFNFKFVSEDKMLHEYTHDKDLHVIS